MSEVASRRMFSRDVLGSDAFAELPFEAQALYVQLSLDADDWGFVTSPKRVQRSMGASKRALDALTSAGFVLAFGSGAVAIAHWWANNSIAESRRKPTRCAAELAALRLTEGGTYERADGAEGVAPEATPAPEPKPARPQRHAYGEYGNVMLTDEQLGKLRAEFPDDWAARVERVSAYCASKGTTYKDYLATIRNWARRERGSRDDGTFDAIGAAIGA